VNAKAGDFTASGTTGNQAVTDPGFQPDFLLMASDADNVLDTGSRAHVLFSVGAASSSTARGTSSIRDRDAQTTMDVASAQVTDQILVVQNITAAFTRVGDLVSFDATGFTINWTTASAFNPFYLALEGGSYKVGSDTQKATTGTEATTGVGFQPTGLFMFSTNLATSASIDQTSCRISIGGSDGTNEGGIWFQSADNVADSDIDSRTYTDKIIGFSTQPSTTDAEADLSSFDSDGFTLNWTTADATAREFVYAAFGSTPAAVTTRMLALTGVGK
jgi:hypothetical protein